MVEHFSTYLLINKKVYEDSFTWTDVWSTNSYTGAEVVFVIDDSGSMTFYDQNYDRLKVARTLIDNLPENSKTGVVRFENYTSILTKTLTDNKETAKSYLTKDYFRSSVGTNMYQRFDFSTNTEDYVLWLWKGDYWNLHSGAENGLYYSPEDYSDTTHYDAVDFELPMTLSLYNYDSPKI